MKKLILASCVVVAFVAYSLHQREGSPSVVLRQPSSSSSSTSTPAPTPTGTSSAAAYKDGQYTGQSADAVYGTIQVKAIIQGGKITDVLFLQYPNDRSNSIAINQQAMPYLKQEAIQVQSGQVDVVSGATDTSVAFVQSLTSALAHAHT